MQEIERKFLIASENAVTARLFLEAYGDRFSKIRQTYLPVPAGEVRIREEQEAQWATTPKGPGSIHWDKQYFNPEYTLTYKLGKGPIREEWEQELRADIGQELLDTATHIIHKTRITYHGVNTSCGGYKTSGKDWQFDFYEGNLTGLVIAEIELDSITAEVPTLPEELQGIREVTGIDDFSNYQLAMSLATTSRQWSLMQEASVR